MSSRLLPFVFVVLLSGVALAQEVAPLSSHVVLSQRRTLEVFPYKGLITSAQGWKRVTASLDGRPQMPDFEQGQVCLLVVADTAGGSESAIASVARRGGDQLAVELLRDEAPLPANNPSLKAFFLVLGEDFPGGVHLVHKTRLLGGGGVIQRTFPAVESDREQRVLPRLGPDLRLRVEMADGSAPPKDLKLRYEATFPNPLAGGKVRPGRVDTVEFPSGGLPFPRIRDGVRHVYAAFAEGYRSRNPLVIERLPRKSSDGSPLPIKHRFVLEPSPE